MPFAHEIERFEQGLCFALEVVNTVGGRGEREVLYYVDPVNPSFRSPEPGTAPCGMALEPVYADGQGGGSDQRGVINVRADRQQLIGVTTGTAVHATVSHELRLLGTIEDLASMDFVLRYRKKPITDR